MKPEGYLERDNWNKNVEGLSDIRMIHRQAIALQPLIYVTREIKIL